MFCFIPVCSCISLIKLQDRLQCKHQLADRCPFDLQFEEDAVDLDGGTRNTSNQFHFIGGKNQYGPVSYLPAESPGGMEEQMKLTCCWHDHTDILQATQEGCEPQDGFHYKTLTRCKNMTSSEVSNGELLTTSLLRYNNSGTFSYRQNILSSSSSSSPFLLSFLFSFFFFSITNTAHHLSIGMIAGSTSSAVTCFLYTFLICEVNADFF